MIIIAFLIVFYISAYFFENMQDCHIVTISQKLIVEVNSIVYLITIRLHKMIIKLEFCGPRIMRSLYSQNIHRGPPSVGTSWK